MKKCMYVLLLSLCMHSTFAMDNQDQSNHEQPAAQDSGFNVFEIAGNVTSWFSIKMTELDNFIGAGAVEQPAENAVIEDSNTRLVRSVLAENKNLSQEIIHAAQESNPTTFIALLRGMRALDIRTNNETETIIRNRLNHLHLERRQVTQELLEKRRVQEAQIHDLRKAFKNADDEFSDDETYATTSRFALKAFKHAN